MKLVDPRLWLAAVSTGIVVWVSIDALERTTPGPLAAVHGRDPELADSRSCSSCHGGWFQSMTSACLQCHQPIAAQLDAGDGLHGTMPRARAESCQTCHSEHHGADFAIVNRQSFALAGVPDPAHFDHRLVGFAMDGAHLELDCAACHEHADAAVLPVGTTRYLGLDQDCATCHEDAHDGTMQLVCAACHGQQSFDRLEARDHDRHLPLVGGHAESSCRACHAANEPRALEALGARMPSGAAPPPRVCADCHASPHRDDFIANAARLDGLSERASCRSCHQAEHRSFDDPAVTVTRAQHAGCGFGLDGPHAAIACADCHRPEAGDFAARHPGRAQDDCRACHEDPHGGQFDGEAGAAARCVTCHARDAFTPHAFGIDAHAQTALPLTGAHVDVACETCHVVDDDAGVRRFRGTPVACAGCHDDAHRGFFTARAAPPSAADCASCHGTTAFAEQPPDSVFDHARDCGFAIHGAHDQAGCESCHPRSAQADPSGRRFGRVAEHFGTFVGCATCHADPHEGRFDAPGLPTTVEGRSGCARCHAETSFRAVSADFVHGRWTGFELSGAHGRADCSACHEPVFAAAPGARTWSPAQGTRCADCHADPHRGQFGPAASLDCARCHQGAEHFRQLCFDHERDSRFPLGEQHRGVACASCHKPMPTATGDVVRYRPLGTACADCHGKNEDPLRRGRAKSR